MSIWLTEIEPRTTAKLNKSVMEEIADSKILEDIKLDTQMSYMDMKIVKTEDIKEEVNNIDNSSRVGDGIEYMEQMILKRDVPTHEVVLESIKYEGEKFTSYDSEMSLKTEINAIKYEVDIREYEQAESMIIENRKIDPGLDYAEHTSDSTEVDMEKQNAFQHCQRNSHEYETEGIAIHSKHKSGTEQHQSLLFTLKDKPTLQVYFKEFHCSLCDFKTKHKWNLSQHLRSKHDDSAKIFHCAQCDFKTKMKNYLLQHHRKKHDRSAVIFHCKFCDYKTKYKNNLVRHRSSHDSVAEIYICGLCDTKFKNKYTFLQHHRLKHNDSREIFHCELCNFKTKYKHSLLQHCRLKHDDSAEILHCAQCDFKTKIRNYLLQHHRLKHDCSAVIFHCEFCDYETKYKNGLVRHRLSHDGPAKIFHCELCEFKTKYEHSLLQHRRLNHDSAENQKAFVVTS